MSELKPCPFCGGEAFVAPSGSCGGVARCGACGCRAVSEYSQKEAVDKWNNRVAFDEDHPNFEALVRAFWRRIEPYKNGYEKELPRPLPDEFRVHMNTAMCVFR